LGYGRVKPAGVMDGGYTSAVGGARARAAAVARAAQFIRGHAELFPPAVRAASATAAAVMAVKVHALFMDVTDDIIPQARVQGVVEMARAFDTGCAEDGIARSSAA
jgi:hypothetical protein